MRGNKISVVSKAMLVVLASSLLITATGVAAQQAKATMLRRGRWFLAPFRKTLPARV
jgi:hypothetical protein